jgi:uncharacterized protein (DUF58 family)
MYAALRHRIHNWVFQLRGPQSGAVVLVQRRVFILPSRQGLLFAFVLLLMLTGSVNYNLSLGFVLTFLLGAMGINAMLYTFRNLANLRVTPGRARPVFAGETARFALCLENPGASDRYAIGLTRDRREASYTDVPARGSAQLDIGVPAPRRGRLRPGRLTLFTRYPLGLYYAWAYVELDTHCIVYPRPAAPGVALPRPQAAEGEGTEYGQGQEDFAGLRQYHPGDSPRHIAWKAAARDQGLLTKQFSGRADSQLWLDWERLPARLGVEEKLSQLARWVLDARALGVAFGLRLPGVTVPPGSGDAHQQRCLEALALYGED